MSVGISKTKDAGLKLFDLDGDGRRFAFAVDGVIKFSGSYDQCYTRYTLAQQARMSDRPYQDEYLIKAMG